MKVLFVYADSKSEWNCSQWNCVSPSESINRTGTHTSNAIYIQEFISNTPEVQKMCENADIIIVERNYFGDTLTIMQFWKVRGKTILCIFDDAYNMMHPQNISYPFWTMGQVKFKDQEGNEKVAIMKPLPLEQFRWGLQIAKGIQVPSVNLAKDWSLYNQTYYIHNFLDMQRYLNVEPLYKHEKDLVIGWCGSLSHHSSFTGSGVLQALKKIAKQYPNVKVLISGDKRVFDLLEVPDNQKVFQPFVPAEQWTPLLKTLDIGLAPLSGEYDKRRSWIKVMEYLALKVPCIATNYPTYNELHDYAVMTENGYKNWEENLIDMIENYAKYKERADTLAYDFALTQTLDGNVEKVHLPLYKKLVDSPYVAEEKERPYKKFDPVFGWDEPKALDKIE